MADIASSSMMACRKQMRQIRKTLGLEVLMIVEATYADAKSIA
jgi:hypothetical protein